MLNTLKSAIIIASATFASTASLAQAPQTPVPSAVSEASQAARSQPNIAGIGIARIEKGKVVWTGYWG